MQLLEFLIGQLCEIVIDSLLVRAIGKQSEIFRVLQGVLLSAWVSFQCLVNLPTSDRGKSGDPARSSTLVYDDGCRVRLLNL